MPEVRDGGVCTQNAVTVEMARVSFRDALHHTRDLPCGTRLAEQSWPGSAHRESEIEREVLGSFIVGGKWGCGDASADEFAWYEAAAEYGVKASGNTAKTFEDRRGNLYRGDGLLGAVAALDS
jgi:hypothetical protein